MLKELIVWGTLDPVAAYLLDRGRAGSRPEATDLARGYYDSHEQFPADERLDPTTIRKWAETLQKMSLLESEGLPHGSLNVKLERTFSKKVARRWRVLPAEDGKRLQRVDPAGYLLAVSDRPKEWSPSLLYEADFFLDVDAEDSFKRALPLEKQRSCKGEVRCKAMKRIQAQCPREAIAYFAAISGIG